MNGHFQRAGVRTARKSALSLLAGLQLEVKRTPDTARLECNLIELKFDSGADPQAMTFKGYGAVFGNVDSYGDVIQQGAFKNTIREAKATGQWPAMLSQHGGMGLSAQDMTPVGVWTDMEEDSTGLALEGKLAATPRGIELYTLMKMTPRPAINGLSIGYVPVKWKMRSSAEEPRRTLEEVKVLEVSPVTFPANGRARIQSAKGDGYLSIRIAEQALRDVGFSQSEAKGIVAHGFKSVIGQRDVDTTLMDETSALLQRAIDTLKSS